MHATLLSATTKSIDEFNQVVDKFYAQYLKELPSFIVQLIGEMGAGKTHFVKRIARHYDIPERDITSPTYSYFDEYISEKGILLHVDLWRVSDKVNFEDLGIKEALKAHTNRQIFIEWADKSGDKIEKFAHELDLPIFNVQIQVLPDQVSRILVFDRV